MKARAFKYGACALLVMCLSCGTDTEQTSIPQQEGWSCAAERDGWERCDGESVVWCHAATHGAYDSAHFHEATNCGQDSLACVELDESTAACADSASSCDAGYSACDERNALNCVDGVVASIRCSLTEQCQQVDDGARCVPLGQE